MKELIGKKFNKLTVVSLDHSDKKYNKYYKCVCDCGKETVIAGYHIKSGGVKSCGCLRNEKIKNVNKTHGFSNNKLYHVWLEIKQRCCNPKNKNYIYYGNKGISVCKIWDDSFLEFHNWAHSCGYKEGLTIDRIDNNGNYEPDNCRWTDRKTQMNNTSRNHYVEYNNQKKTLTEWARHFKKDTKDFSRKFRELKDIDKVLMYYKNKGE